MKASEVLEKYSKGERNFQDKDLRGQSFKNQDLTGVDFSNSQIQGTNFTNAILRDTNFTGVEAGLELFQIISLSVYISILFGFTGFLAAFAGNSAAHIFTINNLTYSSYGWFSLFSTILFLLITIIKDIKLAVSILGLILTLGGAIAVLVVLVLTVFGYYYTALGNVLSAFIPGFLLGAINGFGVFVGAILVATARAIGGTTIVTVSVALATVISISFLRSGIIRFIGVDYQINTIAIISAKIFAVIIIFLIAYLGCISLTRNKKNNLIRSVAIILATTGGTSFQGADLTNANLTKAILRSTDFRNAKLSRTCWYQAKELDIIRPGNTYLKQPQVQQLVLTGNGQYLNFDYQDLRGINLKRANLSHASFIGTDLSDSNLQGADLFESILVQTNLDLTNLSNANLSGVCIENWKITRNTKFDGVNCKYVYLKLPTEGDLDPNRMPSRAKGNFGKNDFLVFITSILDTLELYHTKDINPDVAVSVLKGLTKDYPVQFEIAGLEKNAEGQIRLQVRLFGQVSQSQIQREYYARCEQVQILTLNDPKKIIPDTDKVVAKIIEEIKENSGTRIEYFQNQGFFVADGDIVNHRQIYSGTYSEQTGNFGIGHMSGGEVKGNAKVAGVINEAEQQNLADVAHKIEQLLEQLAKTYPTTTSKEKSIVVGEAVEQIENNPMLKAKVIHALKANGTEAFKETVNHPLVNILVATIEGWRDTE